MSIAVCSYFRRFILSDSPNSRKTYYSLFTLCFIGLFLVAGLIFAANGKSLIASKDGLEQHYTWFVYEGKWIRSIIKSILNGSGPVIPQWSYELGFGADIPTSMSNWIGDPLNLFSALCPVRFSEILFHVLIVVRFYLAGVSFSAFARHKGCMPFSTLCGALTYCFGAYMFIGLRHPNFMLPMILFPLVLIGIDKLLNDESPLLYVIAVFATFTAWFYWAYMVCIFAALYFLLESYGNKNIRNASQCLKCAVRFIAYTATAAAMAGFILLPVLNVVLQMGRLEVDYPVPFMFYDGGLPTYYLQFIVYFLSGGRIDVDTALGFGCIGSLCCLALLVDRDIKTKKLKVAFLVTTVFMLMPVFCWALNGFIYPATRWSFVYVLVVSYAIAVFAPKLSEFVVEKKRLITAVCLLIFSLCTLIPHLRTEKAYFALAILLLGIIILRTPLKKTRIRIGMIGLTCLSLSVMIVYTYSHSEENYVSGTIDAGIAQNSIGANAASSLISKSQLKPAYRYDSKQVNQPLNNGLATGLKCIDFYDNTYNENVAEYLKELAIATRGHKEDYQYSSLDGRAALEALSAVRFFIIAGNRIGCLPYGFNKELSTKTLSGALNTGKVTSYTTDYYLPMIFTYNSIINREDYLKLNPLERQEAMLHACALSDNCESLSNYNPVPTEREVEFHIENEIGCVSKDNKIVSYEPNASFTLTFEGLDNSETYLYITNLDCKLLPVKQAKLLAKQDLGTAYEQNSLTLEELSFSKWNSNALWSQQVFGMSVKSDICTTSLSDIMLRSSNYYTGRNNWLINCGYSEQRQTQVVVTLNKVAEYSFDSLGIHCQPMNGFPESVKLLNDNTIKDIVLDTNRVSCRSSSDIDKLLYLSIAYSKGWKASIDGKPVEILRANTAFMGIPLPAGEHSILLTYTTPFAVEGLLVSAFGFTSLTIILALRKRKLRQEQYRSYIKGA